MLLLLLFTASTTQPVAGPLRLLDVHGAMPPSEFGAVLAATAPAASIPSTQAIAIDDPGYRKLTSHGALVN